MRRALILPTVGLLLSILGCVERDSGVVAAPLTPVVVVLPSPGEEVEAGVAWPASGEPAAGLGPCPPGTFAEHDRCIRIVASEEIPTWTAPTGHLDPCATLTSESAVIDCDPQQENAPVDAGTRSRAKRP